MKNSQSSLNILLLDRLFVFTVIAVFITWSGLSLAHHSFPAKLTEDGEEAIEVLNGTVRTCF